ncbi:MULTISPECIES: hypothetical protein [Streptomyces]|uniref:Uncharacterized protein n=1 Tax=Streptomyces siderophoricus TaxID=2802281 RepID=A0ABS1MWU2_9ACTN|nr:hypothetical protein [Streptomyces sp. 9-7]MBL1092242.1 hypothetical protein [Streptomyces sp. 9-7]
MQARSDEPQRSTRLPSVNPDLVIRFALGRELAAGDPSTYYTGDARGYVDYPVSA